MPDSRFRCFFCSEPVAWSEVQILDTEIADNVFACAGCKAKHAEDDAE
jgi:hypothetical protein